MQVVERIQGKRKPYPKGWRSYADCVVEASQVVIGERTILENGQLVPILPKKVAEAWAYAGKLGLWAGNNKVAEKCEFEASLFVPVDKNRAN